MAFRLKRKEQSEVMDFKRKRESNNSIWIKRGTNAKRPYCDVADENSLFIKRRLLINRLRG